MSATQTEPQGIDLMSSEFWRRPVDERMADFAVLREMGPFIRVERPALDDVGMGAFYAVTRHEELCEISRNPHIWCSGKGAVSIADLPEQAMEFFGSFINMDDPRHAQQRRIVSRSFSPRMLQAVLDSVERVATEVLDGICEQGEVDFVETVSAPFPLLIICDMMGIPRSEFGTVLSATNAILGGGDPEMVGGEGASNLFEAGVTLVGLMNELAEHRRENPTDDLTSALVHNDLGEENMTDAELGSFFILLAVAGNDTTRTATSLAVDFLARHPDQKRIWMDDPDGVTETAVEEIVRYGSPVTFMRRTATQDTTVGDHRFEEGDKVVLFYGSANRDERVFDEPDRFDVRRSPNPHVGFGGPGPHFCLGAHLARRELSVIFRQIFERLPDLEPAGDPVFLEPIGVPLVGGVKRFPVRFTPTRPVGTAS